MGVKMVRLFPLQNNLPVLMEGILIWAFWGHQKVSFQTHPNLLILPRKVVRFFPPPKFTCFGGDNLGIFATHQKVPFQTLIHKM